MEQLLTRQRRYRESQSHLADNAAYEHQLAENVSLLVAELGADYDNLLAPSTANGKNIMPRVAALLDVGQISDILSVESADTLSVNLRR